MISSKTNKYEGQGELFGNSTQIRYEMKKLIVRVAIEKRKNKSFYRSKNSSRWTLSIQRRGYILSRLQNKVNMVCHQAECVNLTPQFCLPLLEII